MVAVGDDDRVTWRTVRVRRDLGRTLELESGLTAASRVIYSPPPELRDGQVIERVKPQSPPAPMQSAER